MLYSLRSEHPGKIRRNARENSKMGTIRYCAVLKFPDIDIMEQNTSTIPNVS